MDLFQGFYLNLDSSAARRDSLQQRLAELGLAGRITRFAALRGDGRPAKLGQPTLGCYLSHQAVIEAAPRDKFTLVLEDDVDLPDRFGERIEQLLQSTRGEAWDMLFLSQTPGYADLNLLGSLLQMKRKLQAQQATAPDAGPAQVLLDAQTTYRWGASAYLIRPGAHDKVLAVLKEGARLGYPWPVDDLFRHAMLRRRWVGKCLFPFLTGLNLAHDSTHTERQNPEQHRIGHTLVNLFTQHMDLGPLAHEAEQALQQALQSRCDPEALITSHLVYRLLTQTSWQLE